MGEGPDGIVGPDAGGVDLAGVDGGALADLAVLDQAVGADDAAGADDGGPPQDGAGQDAGPRCDLDGVLDDHGGAVDQDSVGDMPQQDLHAGLLGGFQRGACGAQRLGVVFHIKRPPYNERKRDLAPSARPAMTGRRRRMGRPRKGTSEPIPVYINVKAAFFQGKCTNLLIQNRQILAPNSWILCA